MWDQSSLSVLHDVHVKSMNHEKQGKAQLDYLKYVRRQESGMQVNPLWNIYLPMDFIGNQTGFETQT